MEQWCFRISIKIFCTIKNEAVIIEPPHFSNIICSVTARLRPGRQRLPEGRPDR